MPHMVIFRSNEGKAGYHQAESLDEAVRFVEHLRNQEQVPDARIFRMQEVPIEFKTYVKVEVAGAAPGPGGGEEPAAAKAPAPVSASEDGPVVNGDKVDDVVVDPMPVANGAANRFGRFNRS